MWNSRTAEKTAILGKFFAGRPSAVQGKNELLLERRSVGGVTCGLITDIGCELRCQIHPVTRQRPANLVP